MGPLLRTALTWIVAIAMPFQAIAASTMQFCGPSHERVMHDAGADDHDAMAPAAHDHAAPAQAHAAHAQHPDHVPSASDAHLQVADDFSQPGNFSCSACASCCLLVAIPVSFVLASDPDLVSTFPSALVARAQSHVPDGLERPPRALLG